MVSVGLLIMNGNFFLVYAQEEQGIRQDFTGNVEYSYSIPQQDSTSTTQPLQYFPTAITIPTLPSSSPSPEIQYTPPQTYYQQYTPPPLLPSSSPIQNVQLTQQQVTVEICSNGIDDDRDGTVDEVVGCTRTQTTIQPQQQPFLQQQQQQQIFPIPPQQPPTIQPSPSPISQCEIYTLTVGGSANLAKAKENIDGKTDLTFEISSILNPYHAYVRYDDLVSGKLWVDKDKKNEKELNYHIKEITNDCKVVAYLDDEDEDDDDDDEW
jgi:hypothetical protein